MAVLIDPETGRPFDPSIPTKMGLAANNRVVPFNTGANVTDVLGKLWDASKLQGLVPEMTPMGSLPNLPIAAKTAGNAIGTGARAGAREIAKQIETGTGVFGKGTIDPRMYAVPKMSEFVPSVKSGEEMIVHHNIPEQGLMNVDQFGGQLAVPSIAISKTANPLSNFGEISLIGSKEMAVPSSKNPVWSFDAYTKRFPKIETKSTREGEDLINKQFLIPYGKFADEINPKMDVAELSKDLRGGLDMSVAKIKYLSEIGQLPDPNTFDRYYDFLYASRDKFRNLEQSNPKFQNDFNAWGANKINELNSTGQFKDVIYAGTDNQGRQKYIPATMENFVKQLKGGAGEEGFNYGLGQTRAKVAPKLKSFNDVINSRDLIVSEEKFNKIKDATNAEHEYLSDKLTNIIDKKHGGYYSRQTADAILEDLYTKKYNPNNEFNKTYDALIPKSIKDKATKVGDMLRKMPTEYFEVKPQRAVPLNEFKGAIIPKEATQQSRDILSKYGISDVYEYATPEQRKELFKKFGSQMFSAGAGLPLASIPYINYNDNK